MSIVLNAGSATAAGAGFVGGFDDVVITTSGNVVDTYDFEPLESVPEPRSLVRTGLTLVLLAVRRFRS